jgi:5-oxoprolinase (ATP-hydrolysing)
MTPGSTTRAWRFAIDRGGTFTDIVAWDPDGGLHSHKVLSRDASHGLDPAVRGIG